MTIKNHVEKLALLGIARANVEATLGRKLKAAEVQVYRAAYTRYQISEAKRKKKKAQGGYAPKGGAKRKAEYVARHNDIVDLPAVAQPDRRERCKYSLANFGITYCSMMLDHEPSSAIKKGLIDKLESCILSGGQLAVMYPRGGGKTTWMDIAITWALLYGHRAYPVVIAAKAELAKSILKTVWAIIERSDEIAEDFPAIALPIRALKGVPQRALSQTYKGEPTRIETASTHFRLPSLAGMDGEKIEEACGAVMAAVGVGASVRGLLDMGSRPDLILFDDPQTKKDALSATRVAWLESFIHSDALGLAAHTKSIAACMTITPQKYGDLAMRIMDRMEHPEWNISQEPLLRWGEKAEDLWSGFLDAYREDTARDDFTYSLSRAYYKEHAAEYADTRVLDPLAYDKASEEDAIHHALKLRAKMGDEAFNAECLLKVSDVETTLPVTFETVSHALNGHNRNQIPLGITNAVAFVDVNTKAVGLTWVLVGFGEGHTACVLNYGRYPEKGSLIDRKAGDLKKKNAIASAMMVLIDKFTRLRFTGAGKSCTLRAVGFDRGYEADIVCRTLALVRKRVRPPFQVCAVRGAGWKQFGEGRSAREMRGDHINPRTSPLGSYLEVHAPYWREIALSGFLETPLMPGSLSVFGANPVEHYEFAGEVAAERLLRKYMHPSGKLAWDWATTGPNHYCDALTMAFAIASWYRCYTALPTPSVRVQQDNPLFDPTQNKAVLERKSKEPTVRRAAPRGGRTVYTRRR